MLKTSMTSISLILIALITTPLANTANIALAQDQSSESTLMRCDTPSQSIRIYRRAGETLMRAYDRKNTVVWLNDTPVTSERLPEGTRYTNQFGEQTVILLARANGTDCTVQLGDMRPEAGTLLQDNQASANTLLEQARQIYPEQVAQIEAECKAPATLDVKMIQAQGAPPRAYFLCWAAANGQGERTGKWLGNLPLTQNDPTFIQPFTCPLDNLDCQVQLSLLKRQYPEQLAAAELSCSIKSGTLFFATAGEATDIRCGFFATTLWDTNGDGTPEYEDPVSVDVSVGLVSF